MPSMRSQNLHRDMLHQLNSTVCMDLRTEASHIIKIFAISFPFPFMSRKGGNKGQIIYSSNCSALCIDFFIGGALILGYVNVMHDREELHPYLP